ncbi:MAG: glycosyltransferase family protein [Paracoccaceae bacterium]
MVRPYPFGQAFVTTPKAAILVNHLRGAGHLSRALTLAKAFVATGVETHVISGGFPVPQFDSTGIRLHQMPPLRSDGADFSTLLQMDGTPVDPSYHAQRATFAIDRLTQIQPQILLVELFPFGRRNLKSEYLDILNAVQAWPIRPFMACSIRDILSQPSKASKVSFAEDILNRHFDSIFVHSDPTIIPLEHTWPVSPEIQAKLSYTGFVAPPLRAPSTDDGRGEIVVSTGSGAFGDQIFEAALDLASRTPHIWRFLVGGPDPNRAHLLARRAPPNVFVDTARPDYRDLLQNAAASVSLCGYNTTMDLLQTGVPAVIMPDDEGSETEQRLRSDALIARPQFARVLSKDMKADTLNDALHQVMSQTYAPQSNILFNGAAESVALCLAASKA